MLAAVSVLVGLVLGVLASGRPLFSVAGWVLAGTVAIALLALFTVSDARRRVADTWHTGRAWTPRAWSAIAVAAVLVVALNAWQFADWVSRR